MPDSEDQGQVKKRKAKKEKRREKEHKRARSRDLKATAKLLSYAAEGRNKKLKKLLESCEDLNVNAFNAEGRTALHQVYC